MKYAIIADEDTVLGFAMVGVSGRAVRTAQEAERAFRATLQERETGIVIITERIADLIRPLVDRYLFSQSFPLIVEIPGRTGHLPDRLGVREMVNAAIGIKL